MDELIKKLGLLTMAMGVVEFIVVQMHCKVTKKTEEDLGCYDFTCHRVGLDKAVKKLDWSDAHKEELTKRLLTIRGLYKRRNEIVHAAYAYTSDDMHGATAGSPIDLRSFGIGFTGRSDDGGWNIGEVATRVDLASIDGLIEELHRARMSLADFAMMIDQLPQEPRPFPDPATGKRLF